MEKKEVSFKSDSELIAYVESQARLALPADWRLERLEEERLAWRIAAPGRSLEDYLLHVSADRSEFVFLHGNSDVGPLDLHHVLLDAKVIDVQGLRFYPLSRAIEYVLTTCKLNRWGLT